MRILGRPAVSAATIERQVKFFSGVAPARKAMADTPQQVHDWFDYTTGRWIYNESLRRSERHVPFNVDALRRVAAKSMGRSAQDITNFRKLAEGGFNRSFEITMADGHKVLARIPYRTTVPKHLAVASEVATIDFVRSHGIPAPKILGYSATSENAVGVEYILMEVMPGRHLGDTWFEMTESERFKLILGVVEMESKLFNIRLPASGSIFYADDLEPGTRSIEISHRGADGRQFCVGPYTSWSMWFDKRSLLPVDRGPYLTSEDVMEAAALKERAFLQQYGRDRLPFRRIRRELYQYEKQSVAAHCQHLTEYLSIIRSLAPAKGTTLNQPTLRHPDLQPHNIFVSESFDIVGLIDWQHCCVLPLFLQCGIPKYFQNYGDEVSEALEEPHLPPDFEDLDDAEKSKARDLFLRRHLHFHYAAATYTFNTGHWDALMVDQVYLRQRLFRHAREPWEGDNVSLKTDLIQAARRWPAWSDSPCPLSYAEAESKECLRLHALQLEADREMDNMCDALGVDSEGWVPVEHYETAQALIATAKKDILGAAESDDARARIVEHWPFDEFDEEA